MSQTPSHIIQRQCIELQMPTRLPHLQIQDEAIALFKEVLQARIGECLDRLFPGEELVQLDNVVIELGRIPAAGWEEEFVARFVEEFELVLQSAQQAHAVEAAARGNAHHQAAESEETPGERGPWAALSYFLAHGFLPWWHQAHDKSSIQDLVQALLAHDGELPLGLRARMQETFAAPNALQRLVHALPDPLLTALANAMGRLSPQAEAALGALTRLLTLPAHGISRSEARIAVWQEILGGAPAPEALLPEDVLAAALLHLAESTEQTPEALLQVIASDDPQLSGAWLRDLAQVQARLAAHPAQAHARPQSPAFRRAVQALHTWLQQADAQSFDLDKALSLLRDLQAALSAGALRDAVAQVIEQLNAARRQRPAAPLQVPSVPVLQRLAQAMREEASHCPAPLLLAIQEFYLRISRLHTPETQESLLAAPLQHLAMEIMRLRASAGTSSQGPYLQAAARQLLAVLDDRDQTHAAEMDGAASTEGRLAEPNRQKTEADAGALPRLVPADILPAPSTTVLQTHASAWIAAQIAAVSRAELAAPASLNLAHWRAWFKALRSPELRPLLVHASWRDLLQAISELLSGQSPALQLRSILQLADGLLADGPMPQPLPSTPATLRAALAELVQIGDAAGSPKEFAQAQARMRAIAGVLHDSAVAHGEPAEHGTPTTLSWKAAWLPFKASLQALATFGRPDLMAAGISAAQLDGLLVLLGQVHAKGDARQVAGILGQLLDIAAQVKAMGRHAVAGEDSKLALQYASELNPEAAGQEPNPMRALRPLASSEMSISQDPATPNMHQNRPASATELISPAIQQRLTRFLNALIALTASLELELEQQAAPIKTHVRKQDWRKEWEALQEWIAVREGEVHQTESKLGFEAPAIASVEVVGDAAGILEAVKTNWESFSFDSDVDLDPASLQPSIIEASEEWDAARRARNKGIEIASAHIDGSSAFTPGVSILGDPASMGPAIQLDPQESPEREIDKPAALWQPVWSDADPETLVQSVKTSSQSAQYANISEDWAKSLTAGRIRRVRLPIQHAATVPNSASNNVLTAAHHAVQSAEVLVSLAELLVPAVQEGQLSDAQMSWWQAAPIQLLADIVAGLRSGILSRGQVLALETQLQGPLNEKHKQSSKEISGQVHAENPLSNLLDFRLESNEAQLHAADAHDVSEVDFLQPDTFSNAEETQEGLLFHPDKNPGNADAQKNSHLSSSDSLVMHNEVHEEQNYFAAPAFRCLLVEQGVSQTETSVIVASGMDQETLIALHPEATEGTILSPAARQRRTAQITQRTLPPLVQNSLKAIRRAAQQAQVDHVLLLLGQFVTRQQTHAYAQDSTSPSTFAQIRLWMQQFPGQALPKALAQALAEALMVLRATTSPGAGRAQSPSQSAAAIPAEHDKAAAAAESEQADAHPSAQQATTQTVDSIAAALPLPQPQWRAKVEGLTAAHQILGPRPVPILPLRHFQTRRTQLIVCIQSLMQLQAPIHGLRRTLDPLTRQNRPASAAPSLSEASRQQLAQAAQQAKSLLREPLPARLHAALRSLQSGLTGHSQGRPDIRAIQRISNEATTLLQGKKGKSAPKEPEKELSIYVKNAGLVLLWPFIQRFFQNLELVEGREFVSPEAHGRAVLFLQYLADPDPETAEHLLPLCKLLCGYPEDRPIALELAPTAEEIEQCEGLLATVPSHHPAMKNMRVDGFRTAWLQRDGALKPRGDHYLLHVEKQAYDVLLEQLPWSIRVIRLPWMHTAILTEW